MTDFSPLPPPGTQCDEMFVVCKYVKKEINFQILSCLNLTELINQTKHFYPEEARK